MSFRPNLFVCRGSNPDASELFCVENVPGVGPRCAREAVLRCGCVLARCVSAPIQRMRRGCRCTLFKLRQFSSSFFHLTCPCLALFRSGRVLVSVQPHLEKREQTQQEVDEAIARMLEEEEARGKGGGGGGGGKGKRLSKISDEGGDELIAKMLQEEEEKAMREQQKRLAGGRPVAVH